MKKSELKEMIKAAMLEGDNYYEDSVTEKENDVKEQDEEDLEAMDADSLIKSPHADAVNLGEADEDVDVEDNENIDIDIEKDVEVDDKSIETDIDVKGSMPGEDADEIAVQSLLMKAQEEAEKLGDEKLTDQIGNTITYFTRAHVATVDEASEGVIDVNVDNPAEDAEIGMGLEESINRMQKLAGLIK